MLKEEQFGKANCSSTVARNHLRVNRCRGFVSASAVLCELNFMGAAAESCTVLSPMNSSRTSSVEKSVADNGCERFDVFSLKVASLRAGECGCVAIMSPVSPLKIDNHEASQSKPCSHPRWQRVKHNLTRDTEQ